jgi:peptidyl-prolyl cis-trans isomerase D
MQLILLVLIVPSFLFFGMQSYNSFVSEDTNMAQVVGQPITQRDYELARREQLDQYRQMMGAQFDPSLFDTPAMRQRLFEQLINQRVLAAAMADNRFSVSDEKLRHTIAANPVLQDDGEFSVERYRRLLAAQGLTPGGFEANLRRAQAMETVLDPIGQSAQIPETVATLIAKALTETRFVKLRRYVATDYRHQVQISEHDIQKWYDENPSQYRIPDQVEAQYLVLDEAAVSTDIVVSEADITRYYDQHKNNFGQDARQRASHIMIQLSAQATVEQRNHALTQAEDVARLAAAQPATFAELAKKYSQDVGSAAKGGDLGWLVPGMLTSAQQKALDALQKGQVSAVVESSHGFHILKLTDFQSAQRKPLTAVRKQIIEALRKQVATTRFADIATKLRSLAYDQRDNLPSIADGLGLKIRQAKGITRTGLMTDLAKSDPTATDANLLNNPRVRQALFSDDVLRNKQNSGVIELSPDTLMVGRVVSYIAAHRLSLQQVKDKIRVQLVDERAAATAAQIGEQALLALRKKSQPAPADTKGFGNPIEVSWQQAKTLPRSILELVMRASAASLPAYVGIRDHNDYVIAQVEKVEPGNPDPAMVATLKQQLSTVWGQTEDEAVLKVLRTQYKVKVLEPAATILQRGEETSAE